MVTHASPWDFMSECTAIFPRGALWKAARTELQARTSASAGGRRADDKRVASPERAEGGHIPGGRGVAKGAFYLRRRSL